MLRDGVPIAKIDAYTTAAVNCYGYSDYMAVGSHRYRIRMVDDSDNYVDSEEIEVTTAIRQTTVAPIHRPQDIITLEMRAGGKPEHTDNLSLVTSSTHFDGRKFPAVTFSGFLTRQPSLTHSLSRAEYAQLEELIRCAQPVVIRNADFHTLVGTVSGIAPTYLPYGVDFTLTIDVCDYVERVPYD